MARQPIDANAKGWQTIYPGVCQKVSFTGASTQSAATTTGAAGLGTIMVELFATEDCWIKIGSDPTAVANNGSSFFMGAGLFKTYGIIPGHKIAVIRDTTSGDLHIIEAL